MLNFNFNPFPFLSTDRLRLRKIEITDLEDFHGLRNNEQTMRYIDRPQHTIEETKSILEKSIAELEGNENINWALTLKDDPKLIGTVGFWKIDRAHHRAEIGYVLLPELWNSGFMSEALNVILTYGYEVMKLHSVEANVNPENAASIRLLHKLGFVKEAHFRENYYFDGKFLDSAIYCLICSDFMKA